MRGTLVCGVLVVPLAAAAAFTPPPRPTRYATDGAGVVDDTRLRALNERLAQFERDTSNQVLVVVERRLPEGTTLEEYANAAFHAWGVGQKGRNNGVVFFAFVDDRKMRIEVGYGLEGSIPDARANQIISLKVAPSFRRGDYTGGVEAAADEMMKAARGEAFQGTGRTAAEGGAGVLPVWIWGVPVVALLGAWVGGRAGTTLWQRVSKGSIGFAATGAMLATFSTPLTKDVRPLALAFGVLLLNLAVAAVIVIGKSADLTGRRRVGLGMLQAGTGLVIASVGVAALSVVLDAGHLAASAFLAAIPVLLLGALLHSVDPVRVATLLLGRIAFVVFLLGAGYIALCWYLVLAAPVTTALTIVSLLVWIGAWVYSRTRGWRFAPDVDWSSSGGGSGGSGWPSSGDSSSSSGSDFSGGGGDSGGGGASGGW